MPEKLKEMSLQCKGKATSALRNAIGLPSEFKTEELETVIEGIVRAAVLEVFALLEESTVEQLKKNNL